MKRKNLTPALTNARTLSAAFCLTFAWGVITPVPVFLGGKIGGYRAQADMSESQIAGASAEVNQNLAEISAIARASRGNYAGAAAARQSEGIVDQCFLVTGQSNIGDLNQSDLSLLKRCVSGEIEKLANRLQKLKAMQQNSKFEYAVFSESVRLLSTAGTGSRQAMAPIADMLRAAEAASALHSEKILIARMNSFTNKIVTRLTR